MASWYIPEDEGFYDQMLTKPRPNLIDAANFAENRKRQKRVDLKRAEQQGLTRDPWNSSKFWKETGDENVVEPVELQRFATWKNPVGGPTGLSNIDPKEGNAVILDPRLGPGAGKLINREFGVNARERDQNLAAIKAFDETSGNNGGGTMAKVITSKGKDDSIKKQGDDKKKGKGKGKRFVGRGRNSIAANQERIREINPLPKEKQESSSQDGVEEGTPTETAAEVDKTDQTWDAVGAGAKMLAKLLEEQRSKGASRVAYSPHRSRYRAMIG